MLQFFLWFIIIVILIFMIAYIYINEKEKHQSMKLSEEVQILKKFQEQEKKSQAAQNQLE